MGFITADRNQQHMFGYSIDDFVEKQSKSRYIVETIEQMDLTQLYDRYSDQGAESYDPKIMLEIWAFSYSEGVSSSRKIEEFCKKHLDYIYISANLRPDHSTLCRFIQRNSDLWPKYFLETVKMAKQKGLGEFKQVMIDGTKIKARSSKKQSMRERKLNKYLEAIEADIQRYKEEVEATDAKEEQEENKIKELEEKQRHLKECKKELRQRKQTLAAKDRENHQINIVEKDALMMDLGGGKGYAPAYNGQIAVDADTQIIVANDVVQQRNDEKQFSEMHQQTDNNLGEDKSRQYCTDTGYYTLEQIEYIQNNNIDAYIGDPQYKNYKEMSLEQIKECGKKIKHVDFKYDSEKDLYICPAGKEATFTNQTSKGRNYSCKSCSACELKYQCLDKKNKKQVRTVSRDSREVYAEVMRRKMNEENGQKMLLKRQCSVEPVFGNIKENLGFRRFRRRDIENVKNEFALMCMAHNINKLFKLIFCLNLVAINRKIWAMICCLQFHDPTKNYIVQLA